MNTISVEYIRKHEKNTIILYNQKNMKNLKEQIAKSLEMEKLTQSNYFLNLLCIKKGLKKVTRRRCDIEHYPEYRKNIQNCGLNVCRSDFSISIDGQTYKKTKIDDYHNKGNVFTYISDDLNDAQMAKKADQKGDVHSLGRLLSYPECCINKYLSTRKKYNIHPDFPRITYEVGERYSFLMNNTYFLGDFPTNFKFSFLEYFPCSYKCRNSLEISHRKFSILSQINDKSSRIIAKLLQRPILYYNFQNLFVYDSMAEFMRESVNDRQIVKNSNINLPTPIKMRFDNKSDHLADLD